MNQALVGLCQRLQPMIVVGRDHLAWTVVGHVFLNERRSCTHRKREL